MTLFDYELQLTRLCKDIKQQHLVSINQIKARFRQISEEIDRRFANTTKSKVLEELISLKMAYINLMIAIQEIYGINSLDDDKMLEKGPIEEIAKQQRKEAIKQASNLENINDQTSNEIPTATILEKYEELLRMMKEKLDEDIKTRKYKYKRLPRATNTIL